MGTHPIFESDFDCLTVVMDLLGSIMGKMEKRSKGPEPSKQQKVFLEQKKKVLEREREKKKFMKKKIEERIQRFVGEIEAQQKKIKESDDPDLIERLPDLLKVNFKPMDDIWRSTVHEIANDYGLNSFGLGKGEERYVCVVSRQPTQNEMISLRAQNPAKPDEQAEPAPKAPVVEISSQPESSQKSSKSAAKSSYHLKYAHLVG